MVQNVKAGLMWKNVHIERSMKTFFSQLIASFITSTCNTKCLEERFSILSSFAQKLQLKQAEEYQVYFGP